MCNTSWFLWQQWLHEGTSMLRHTILPVLLVTMSVCTWMKALTGGLPPDHQRSLKHSLKPWKLHVIKALEGIYYNTLLEVRHKVDCRLDTFRTVLTSSKHFRMTLKLFLLGNIALNLFYAKRRSNCSGDIGTRPVAASEIFLWYGWG
jgi:hypothetical protein